MKTIKTILIISFLYSIIGTVAAQDVIVKADNTTVLSKVVEVTSTEVKYKKWQNQDGPTHSLLLTEISRINYQNGEVEMYSNTNTQQNAYQQSTTYPQQSYGASQLYDDREHTVKGGETLSSIAREYGCTVAELKKWNNLKGSRVRGGQKLKIK